MDADRGEVALNQKVVKLAGAGDGADEDDDLVELEGVEEVAELPVLSVLGELDKVLLESVKGQLLLIVDQNLEGLSNEEKRRGKGMKTRRKKKERTENLRCA